jgi:hypothetical protein
VSALARFEQLEGEVGAQRERVAELDRARHDRARKVESARAALLEFHRAREANGGVEGPDLDLSQTTAELEGDTREHELVEALREAESGLSLRTVTFPHGGGTDVELQVVDELAEARFAGAQEALQAAEDRLHTFASEHFEDAQVERASKAAAARDVLIDADRVYRLATQGIQVELAWQTRFCTAAGREDLVAELPENPGAWIAQVPRKVPAPMPKRLTEPMPGLPQ